MIDNWVGKNRIADVCGTVLSVCLFICFSLLTEPGFAQEDPVIARSENSFVENLRRLQPRPKFFQFHYSSLGDLRVDAKSETFGNSSALLQTNQRYSLGLRFPVSLREKTSIIGGVNFRQESFDFVDIQSGDNIYSNLDESSLTIVGANAIIKSELSERSFLFAFWSGNLNSDDIGLRDNFRNQLKMSLVLVHVRNKTPIKQLGYGAAFGYIFGRASVFPVMIYNETYSYKWHLEALLPKSVKLRYTVSPEMHLYWINHVSGASYYIRERRFEGFQNLSFQRSSFGSLLSIEREVYDFIWVGASFGLNVPLNLYISGPRDRRSDAVIAFSATPSSFFDLSVFLVVPKKIHFKDAKSR